MSDTQINREALFSAETQDYRMPSEPDAGDMVTVRMRTAKNGADHVYYIEKKKAVLMKKSASDSLFDYYEHKITVKEAQILYHLRLKKMVKSVITTVWDHRIRTQTSLILRSHPAFIPRIGQRAQ